MRAILMMQQENNHVRPRLFDGKGLRIVKGRHPLHELVEQTFISNDVLLSTDGSMVRCCCCDLSTNYTQIISQVVDVHCHSSSKPSAAPMLLLLLADMDACLLLLQ